MVSDAGVTDLLHHGLHGLLDVTWKLLELCLSHIIKAGVTNNGKIAAMLANKKLTFPHLLAVAGRDTRELNKDR